MAFHLNGELLMSTLLLAAINPVFLNLIVIVVAIALGSILGWLCELVKLPLITGYFLSGILIGLYLTWCDECIVFDHLKALGNIALSFIVFELGTRLHMRKVKRNISEVIVIVVFQAIWTIGLVTAAMLLFRAPWEMALLIGVIAMATSPETIMVLSRNYRSKGHLTDSIMSHIGLDDILVVIIFSISLTIATSVNRQTSIPTGAMILEPLLEIFGSIIIGGAIGAVLALFIHISKRDDARHRQFYLVETVCAVLLITALTFREFHIGHIEFSLSPILAPLFMGIVFTNLVPKDMRKENDAAIDSFTPPFIMLFFSLIGIQLVVSVIGLEVSFWYVLIIALAYIIIRVVGKQVGVVVGAKVKKTPPEIVKYLVWSLLPQATVSIGLAQIVMNETSLPIKWRQIIFIVVLIAATVYQVVGPKIAEKTLIASHEIAPGKLNFFFEPKEDPLVIHGENHHDNPQTPH
jgi:NhaP-type Na+/H+ or K+/H+ antiporter